MSNFSYKDGDGKLTQVPVMYGDITRQVGHIIRDNSENKIPSAPRIGVYITGLELDRDRLADASFVGKVHLRERDYDQTNNEYLNTQGKNVTVERLMPTPYKLTVNADIWSTNTEQKLQIMEQILMLFNPSLEIQTTDNYIDWTSLSVVDLDAVNFSSRSMPTGTESEIDVGSLTFTTPIYISPPVKVKKLGVITNIIMSMFNEDTGNVDLGATMPELKRYNDEFAEGVFMEDKDGTVVRKDSAGLAVTAYNDYDVLVIGNTAQLIHRGVVGNTNWNGFFEALPGTFRSGLSQIQLTRLDINQSVNGTVAVNATDETTLIINWDEDTIPSDMVITGSTGDRNKIDYIIDPTNFNPTTIKSNGIRVLLLGAIGSTTNTDGADAWKNNDGTDFVASENDIVEWTGTKWQILFDSSTVTEIKFVTNLNTGIQYKWTGTEWVKSIEGEYRNGAWRIQF
tara:strand:+ start:64 stop:1425 length:1362 start_codon:yes stop_codon:yes gene_type:complete